MNMPDMSKRRPALPLRTWHNPSRLRQPEEDARIQQIVKLVEQQRALGPVVSGPLELWRRQAELARQAMSSVAAEQRRQAEVARQAMDRAAAEQRRQAEVARQAMDRAAAEQRRQAEVARQAMDWVAAEQRRQMQIARQAMADFAARFRMPEPMEAARLMSELRVGPLSEALARYAELESGLQIAMDSMRAPWLDTHDAMRSMLGFAQLQGIGHALDTTMPAFGDDLASALRTELGDWRDPITWPQRALTDPAARSDFYSGLGFDQALTDFPAPAFGQSLRIAGLRREPPPLAERYGAPVPPSVDSDEEEALERTNNAHDWLLRLETQLRRFIDEQMTREFGQDWPRHRLPKELYEKWLEKKRIAQSAGAREWPLIAYADFTDYEPVICKRDNWRAVFASVFSRAESVRESFQRLYPLRLDTMHARPISQDDELLLYVETKRLAKAIIV